MHSCVILYLTSYVFAPKHMYIQRTAEEVRNTYCGT